jgi:TonB family protein
MIILIVLLNLTSLKAYSQKDGQVFMDTSKILSYKMNYPEEAKRNGIQGTVKIKVTYDSLCNIVEREIIQSLGYGCDEEALLTLKKLEEKVKVVRKCQEGEEMTLPFIFKLD